MLQIVLTVSWRGPSRLLLNRRGVDPFIQVMFKYEDKICQIIRNLIERQGVHRKVDPTAIFRFKDSLSGTQTLSSSFIPAYEVKI